MPFNNPAARAAFFEKLKNAGGASLPNTNMKPPQPAETPNLGMSKPPGYPSQNTMMPKAPGMTPHPLNYMKKEPQFKATKFPKLKKFF